MKGDTVPLRGADDRATFQYRVARMVTSPISATVSRSIWNYKSHAQTYLQHFPQLVVRNFERTFGIYEVYVVYALDPASVSLPGAHPEGACVSPSPGFAQS